MSRERLEDPGGDVQTANPTEPIERLLRDLRTSGRGLGSREAGRRLLQYGPNELQRRGGRRWPREIVHQLTHPLALLLWAAAVLAEIAGIRPVAVAVVLVILLNAAFAFLQEQQAERAVEALSEFLPDRSKVLRDSREQLIDARELVPGDVIVLEEGDRVSADARLIAGSLEVNMSALTGESALAHRTSAALATNVPLLRATELVFSGTTCTSGEARAVVFATGMQSELGRIAALSERVTQQQSPLDQQVRRVAWLIAAIAVLFGIAFIPVASIGAGLSLSNSVVFAIGLLVGNVPEGLLPVITLALAVGVRELARQGALVKRLSAVETLGSTDVICTDKTGTLTENRMRAQTFWTTAGESCLPDSPLAASMVACTTARVEDSEAIGDPTEIAMLEAAREIGLDISAETRDHDRLAIFHFDPGLKRMATICQRGGERWVDAKGAPESILPLCTSIWRNDAADPRDEPTRTTISGRVDAFAEDALRVLAIATRRLPTGADLPHDRETAETELCFLGLVAMADPPRPDVADAVAKCQAAGIRIIIVTGDHGLTAQAVARVVGITGPDPRVVTGEELATLDDPALEDVLEGDREVIFARSSPEAKLRISDALRAHGHVVAMTGDGVNDAPALRAADIGVAMGRSGTDVAREAATMILTDDNFASIVAAVEAGRRVFDNIRKFMLYIFAHTTPEIVPFLVFALSGGAIPLPLTVMQLLALDVGTETLPALALGREPAERGLMARPPHPRGEGVVTTPILVRAWLFLGAISAVLAMSGYFFVLFRAGWSTGDPVGAGDPLHHSYVQATTMTFAGLVAGQIGTAFAARTERASLRSAGVFTNRLLLWGIAFEVALAALFIYTPLFQDILGTASLPPIDLAFLVPFPFVIWGADELRRYVIRRHAGDADPVTRAAARS